MKLFPLFAVVLAGCVSSPEPLRLDTTHPANPDAAQAPYVAEHNTLLAVTNSIAVATNAAPAAEHEHDKHKAK